MWWLRIIQTLLSFHPESLENIDLQAVLAPPGSMQISPVSRKKQQDNSALIYNN
ncbi:hypothetical protein DFR27_1705 [Umboniibacter marinipuniceus]|uniref:Uncharacterized protein n=1 Tax=Umboniibacter marinipuniceus TaxID=569599 RepID=A0A3M0A3N8_9GAMM|nr:hypothetical protein DFR27_1705 [Umboniibacter marinipuniceus]